MALCVFGDARMTAHLAPDTHDAPALATRIRSGNMRAAARALRMIEEHTQGYLALLHELCAHRGHAHVIALTGSPGSGKSSLINHLVHAYRRERCKVGVLVVDPTSPYSGGALLGDRIRMQDHALDDQVWIRSVATRGHLGGLSEATPMFLDVMDAYGCDVIFIETVGVGQSELEVSTLADTTVVVLAPGMGDDIQATKAGILEVADIFVVNKADRDGADNTVRDLEDMIRVGAEVHSSAPDDHPSASDSETTDAEGISHWKPSVIKTIATDRPSIDDLVQHCQAHQRWLQATLQIKKRRSERDAATFEQVARHVLARQLELAYAPRLQQLSEQVLTGTMDPYEAAQSLLRTLEH
jgi:LAO/AO transport system kinase